MFEYFLNKLPGIYIYYFAITLKKKKKKANLFSQNPEII